MKIDRSNYEIWFIDWLDGNLNDHQLEQFNLFLSENPDLQEELKEIDSSVIIPPAAELKDKSRLKRTPADISEIQFDYLCAAYAENDLTAEELEELFQITYVDPHRKNVSGLFRKLKLHAPDVRYINRKKLLKRTPLQKTIRLSAVLLGVAASVALLISLSIFIPGNENENMQNISLMITNDIPSDQSTISQQIENTSPDLRQSEEVTMSKVTAIPVNKITVTTDNQDPSENEMSESLQEHLITEAINKAEVPVISDIALIYQTGIENLSLIPLSVDIQVQPDERWAVARVFAKVFRDKILKEETIDDSPIKGYEIAEAGVTGLNKLLGWEMAFEKNNDENGELKSIYFSSKLLKIQAPVNKPENRY